MKRGRNLSPGTIRHYVGALARCLDWGARKEHIVANPLRLLPKRYASYTDADAAVAKKRIDQSRDRRISAEEEQRVRAILAGEKPEGRQRALTLMHQEALICLFELAIETAMRLREMYTLSYSQVSIKDRTIYLDKTKNGDKRQVPLSSVALVALENYGLRKKGHLFPWWDGDANSEVLKKTTGRLSRQFARIFDAAGCQDMRFHDLRHEATSRLYERTDLSDLEIAKITGHKDPKMLMRYANLRGSNLAGRLW
jgi:integrase